MYTVHTHTLKYTQHHQWDTEKNILLMYLDERTFCRSLSLSKFDEAVFSVMDPSIQNTKAFCDHALWITSKYLFKSMKMVVFDRFFSVFYFDLDRYRIHIPVKRYQIILCVSLLSHLIIYWISPDMQPFFLSFSQQL